MFVASLAERVCPAQLHKSAHAPEIPSASNEHAIDTKLHASSWVRTVSEILVGRSTSERQGAQGSICWSGNPTGREVHNLGC